MLPGVVRAEVILSWAYFIVNVICLAQAASKKYLEVYIWLI
jgi:hypothetical protein